MDTGEIKDQINKNLRTELKTSQALTESLKSQLVSSNEEHSENEIELLGKIESLSTEIVEIQDKIRSKEDIEHIIHHDSRSSLASLAIAPNILLDSNNLDEVQRDILNNMKTSATRLVNLFDMNLTLQNVENGKYNVEATKIDVLDIIHSVMALHETTSQSKKIYFTIKQPTQTDKTINGFYIFGNEVLTFNILNNLIANAIEASHSLSEIQISLNANSNCTVEIRNTSEVPERIRDIFFNKFVTADKKNGVGIGTYSAMLMAKAQNGDITLDCSEHDATTITVYFPKVPIDYIEEKSRS